MKIGILCRGMSLRENRENLIKIARMGYDCADMQGVIDTKSEWYDLPTAEAEREAVKFGELARELGIALSQTHGPWTWPIPDTTEEGRRQRAEEVRRCIALTGAMGAPYMVLHCLMPFGTDKNPEPERFYAMNRAYFTRLAEEGKKCGVTVAIENMPFPALTLARPSELIAFVRDIDSPNLRICLDTGHCHMVEPSVGDAVRRIGKELLCCTHIHDNNGQTDSHSIPYDGGIDWADVNRAFHEIGYEGAVSLETDIRPDTPEPLKSEMEAVLLHTAREIAK